MKKAASKAKPKSKYIGFDALAKKVEGEGKSKKYAEGVAASVMHKKYKEKDIKAHQKSGTSMKKVAPKKK
jgi:hypothetical protein